MFSIVDRYKLWNCAAFGCDDDNGGGGGGGSSSSSSSDKDDDKPSGVGAGNKLPDGSTSLGSVSATGQYAGDGFEWKQNPNTNALTRVYTGANANAGLGTDVRSGGTSDKNTKEVIANISLNEGTEFAGSAGSATDQSLASLVTTGDSGASDSYAAQVGVTDYNPVVSYDSTQTGAVNEAARETPTQTFDEAFAENRAAGNETFTYNGKLYNTELAPELTGEELLMSQEVVSQPTGLPTEVAPDFFDQFAPTIDYTVSQGEAGRGGPDSAAPTFTYQPGVDPEMETLVSLLNTAPDTLSYGERLMAQQYQRDKLAGGSPTGGVQVADAGIFSNLANYATDLGSDIKDALLFRDPIGEKVASGLVGIPGEASNMAFGLQDYFQARPVSYTGNPLLDLTQEIMLRTQPDATRDMILSQTPEEAAQRGQFSGIAGEFLGDLGEKVEGYFFPEGRDQAVVTGTTPGELALETVEGQGGYSGLGNVVAEEVGGGLSTDIPLSYLGLPGMTASAILNFGEQIGGGEANTRQALDVLEQQGILQNNPVFLDALEKQGGDVDAAKDALVRANVFSSAPAIGGTGAIDAFIPAPGKGFIGAGKNLLLRGGVEGGQEVVESMAALDGLNNLLNLQGDQQIKVTQDASGNFVMGALAGTGTSLAASPLSGLTASQREAANQDALANQAAMEQAAGTQGVASFAVAPANQTGVSTQPEAMTTAPTVFNPNVFPTAGELAQSNVPTAYDIEQDKVAGLLEAPQLDPMATSLDVMAAQEIIENQIRETGTISPEVMTNLQAATGLSMNDLSSMAVNAATGTLGGQTFSIDVGSETPSDLMDQPTGIGGGSNISVEPLPSGETLLRNNDTGRTTVVDQGADLAAAIQTFDEVTTPFGAPKIDTTAPSLPPFNVAGAPGQPVLPAGTDTAPILPTRSTTPDIPRIDVAGLESLRTDSLPNIDTASFQQGTDDTTAEVQLPATTDGDTLPAATGTEVIIDDDGSARQVGGLEGEILGPEISTEVTPDQDTGVTIDMEVTPETDTTTEIGSDTVVSLPPTDQDTTPSTPITTDQDTTITPLTEVGEFPEPPEEPIVVDDEEEPVVVEVDDDDDDLVSQITTTDKDGNTITECPEGYREVQTPDGIMCEKIETATTTTGRRTYGVGRTTTTGLAGNIGRQIPRSRTRTTTTTSRSRVKPTTRSA